MLRVSDRRDASSIGTEKEQKVQEFQQRYIRDDGDHDEGRWALI
jgi:hypothetical protein